MERERKKQTKKVDVKQTKWIFIHALIIAVLVVAGAVAAHFGLVLFTRHDARCTVPQFKGLILTEAEYVASDLGLNIVINDSLYVPTYEGGLVLDQLPKAGVGVKPGRTIYVTINAFGAKMVSVPYVAGRSLRQAKNMLEVAGLQVERLIYKPDMATNYVLAEYFAGEEITSESRIEAKIGSGVTLHVGISSNDNYTRMPQLIGMSLREAKSRLWESGLNIGVVNMSQDITAQNIDRARVYSQGVTKGGNVPLGRDVSLVLTLDSDLVDKLLLDIEKEELAAAKAAKIAAQREADSLQRIKIESLSAPSTPQVEASVDNTVDSFFE